MNHPDINVSQVIDRSRVGALQIRVVALCAFVALMDGFDMQTMGIVAPRIAAEWGLPPYSFGPALSASLAGIMLGAMALGVLGDRIGRRLVLIGAFAFVGISSLLSSVAETPTQLIVFRFLTGLGVGGCMPNFAALTAEYVPSRRIAFFVTLIYSAVPLGAVIAGYLAGDIIEHFGWHAVFVLGGVIPLVGCVVLLFCLPESVRFLVRKGSSSAKVAGILSRIDIAYRPSPEHRFTIDGDAANSSPRALFADGRAPLTIGLWVVLFFSLACLYVLASWLPSLFTQQGWPMSRAIQSVSYFWLGGIMGGLTVGWLMDRFGRFRVLGFAYAAAACLIAAIGSIATSPLLTLLVITAAGVAVVGAQTGTTALAASVYPTSMRSTGVGWGLGVGRLGGVLSPLLGGLALAAGWSKPMIFVAAAVPAALCAITILLLKRFGVMTTAAIVVATVSLPVRAQDEVRYINGKVITVDSRFSVAEAFAVAESKFVAVGSTADIQKRSGAATIVDLKGRTVTPGFIDTHAHTIFRGLGDSAEPSLVGLRSVAQITARIAEAVAKAAPGEWIHSSPIGVPPDYFHLPESLAEKRWPTRADLDKVSPNNPVYIPTPVYWPHPAIFNSAALALLGITRDTPDTLRQRIEKDAKTGEPTGRIYGISIYTKSSPLNRKLDSLMPKEKLEPVHVEAMRRAFEQNVAAGVTTAYEGHGNFYGAFVPELQKLHAAGKFPGRIVNAYEVPTYLPLPQIEAWMQQLTEAKGKGTGDDYFRIAGVTVSLDGPPQYGLALYRKPYLDAYGQPGNGASNLSVAQLIDIARLAVKNDLRLNIQAAGDGAADIALDALEAMNRETPIVDRQWIGQHFHHPSREDIARLKALGMVVQTYSGTDWSKGAETYVSRFPGSDLWKAVAPYRWWIDSGITVTQSSDGAHYEPMFTLWESLVRLDGRTGKSLLTPPKTITRQEALQIYTINGARLLQWDDRLGSIEAGKLADFVVLDRDILKVPVRQIRDTRVVMTAVGGRIVHGR